MVKLIGFRSTIPRHFVDESQKITANDLWEPVFSIGKQSEYLTEKQFERMGMDYEQYKQKITERNDRRFKKDS